MIAEEYRDYRKCSNYRCNRVFDNSRKKGTHSGYSFNWCDRCIETSILYERAEQDILETQYKAQQESEAILHEIDESLQ